MGQNRLLLTAFPYLLKVLPYLQQYFYIFGGLFFIFEVFFIFLRSSTNFFLIFYTNFFFIYFGGLAFAEYEAMSNFVNFGPRFFYQINQSYLESFQNLLVHKIELVQVNSAQFFLKKLLYLSK